MSLGFLSAVSASVGLFVLTWLLSIRLKNVSIMDCIWGLSFVVISWAAFSQLAEYSTTQLVLLAIVSIWGLRLSLYLIKRAWGKEEDYRYQSIRAKYDPGFWWKSLGIVFAFQFVLSLLISSPLIYVFLQGKQEAHPIFLAFAVLLWAIGFYFEVVGDWQLTQFKNNPQNKGKVLDTGVWHLTRHPNYFGDGLQWCAFYLVAAGIGGFWTIYSPVMMVYFLRRVTGADLLEKKLVKSKPGFEEYMRTTPAFIPDLRKLWRPKAQNISDNDAFVSLVQLCREDEDLQRWVMALIRMDDFDRQSMLHSKINELRLKQVPEEHIHIFECQSRREILAKIQDVLSETEN